MANVKDYIKKTELDNNDITGNISKEFSTNDICYVLSIEEFEKYKNEIEKQDEIGYTLLDGEYDIMETDVYEIHQEGIEDKTIFKMIPIVHYDEQGNFDGKYKIAVVYSNWKTIE